MSLVAIDLANLRGKRPLRIIVFERRHLYGHGRAYSMRCLGHLLTVPPASMTALPDEPDYFSSPVSPVAELSGPVASARGLDMTESGAVLDHAGVFAIGPLPPSD